MTGEDEPVASPADLEMNPQRHYDEFGEGEWTRLDADPVSRLEFENTIDVLAEYLPEDGHILDAGGGPGRYSIWFAERGYQVTHLDISRTQIQLAQEKTAEHGVADRVECTQGTISGLPFTENRFEAVCCLGGPLSHVLSATDRERAIREFTRVAQPDAPIVISVIGRLNALRDGIKHALEEHPELLTEIAESGDFTAELVRKYGGEGWAECHFFRAHELEELLEGNGVEVTTLVGLEGPASTMREELEGASDRALTAVEEIVHMLRTDRSVVDFSEHILAVGYA